MKKAEKAQALGEIETARASYRQLRQRLIEPLAKAESVLDAAVVAEAMVRDGEARSTELREELAKLEESLAGLRARVEVARAGADAEMTATSEALVASRQAAAEEQAVLKKHTLEAQTALQEAKERHTSFLAAAAEETRATAAALEAEHQALLALQEKELHAAQDRVLAVRAELVDLQSRVAKLLGASPA